MTLTVILLSLSDVRLVKQDEHRSRRSAMQHRSASLSHCLFGLPTTILLKLMYILRALYIPYWALTRRASDGKMRVWRLRFGITTNWR